MSERSTLMEVRDLFRPAADVWILNGAMVMEVYLSRGDRVMLIERGVVPPRDELESVMAARHTPGSCADESVQLELLVWAVWDLRWRWRLRGWAWVDWCWWILMW